TTISSPSNAASDTENQTQPCASTHTNGDTTKHNEATSATNSTNSSKRTNSRSSKPLPQAHRRPLHNSSTTAPSAPTQPHYAGLFQQTPYSGLRGSDERHLFRERHPRCALFVDRR